MKNIRLLSQLLLCLMVLSCSKNKEIPVVVLEKDKEIGVLKDSTYLSGASSLLYYKNGLLISDYQSNRIYTFDHNLNLTKIIGTTGNGPGEFRGLGQVFAIGDTIYAENGGGGKQNIECLTDNGKNLSTIELRGVYSYHSGVRYFVKNNFVYLPVVNKGTSILKCNLSTQENLPFGEVKRYRSEMETRIKNSRHLLTYGDYTIAISNNRPEIELYGKDNKYIKTFDFNENGFLDETIKIAKSKGSDENSYFNMVSDAYINKNKMYLLLPILNPKGYSANTVLEIILAGEDFNISRMLNLGDGYYDKIAVNDNYLASFNCGEKSTLVRFKL